MQLIMSSPSPEHLLLLKYLSVIILLLHLPFIGMMIGGAFFSVIFNALSRRKPNHIYSRFAKDLIDTVAVNKSIGFILGVLPLFTLTLIFPQVFYNANLAIGGFWGYITVLASIGLALLYIYQYMFDIRENRFLVHIGTGILGVLCLFAAYLIFAGSTSLVVAPEQWRVVRKAHQLIFSWNVISRYLHFLTAAFAITGGGILFFYFVWPEGKSPHASPSEKGFKGGQGGIPPFRKGGLGGICEGILSRKIPLNPPLTKGDLLGCPPLKEKGGRGDLDEDYRGFVKKFGAGLALTFTLLQPILVLWNLITLPQVAISSAVFGLAVIALFLLMVICYALYAILRNSAMKVAVSVFVLFLLTFLVTIINDQIAIGNATKEHTMLLVASAEEARSELELKREKTAGGETTVDERRGEAVFTRRCSTCHRFDKRFVGPPFNQVIPKYQNKADALTAFIRNPTKKNPAYKAMPKLKLTEREIEAVAVYLLKKIESSPKGNQNQLKNED